MKLSNCRIDEAVRIFAGKDIVFFGQGAWIKNVEFTPLMLLEENFAYAVDNAPKGELKLGNSTLQVFFPDVLKKEKNKIIILTSPVYMYEMFIQLNKMELDDSIVCYAFPFMQMISRNKSDLTGITKPEAKQRIPKIIHSFWFSGDEKPEAYQKCIDTWPSVLNDYEIREWNKDNYDWHKNGFVEKAIECEAWAFATDYARLDILNEFGGIYLDMDVEVLKSFDDLLDNEAILSFSNNIAVDLAVVGSVKENKLIKNLLRLYENTEIPNSKGEFVKFFQPAFIRRTLAENGIRMDGTFQRTQYATVYPNEFFMPQDHVLFRHNDLTGNTHCIHYDNFGWSNGAENKKNKKIRDNNLLWDLLENDTRKI